MPPDPTGTSAAVAATARRRVGRTIAGAVLAITASVMPMFMTAASAALIRGSFPFDEARLGAAAATYFTVIAIGSVPAGAIVDRLGADGTLRLSALLSTVSLVGIGAATTSAGHLVGWLTFGGAACGLAVPASSTAIAALQRPRSGVLFGVQQAAATVAALLAGLTLPLVSVRVGWQPPFLAAAVLALGIAALPPREPRTGGRRPRRRERPAPAPADDRGRGDLIAVSVAIGLGAAAGVSVGSFLVDAAVADGFSPGAAGGLLAAASIGAILARILLPVWADHRQSRLLPIVAGMYTLAAIGFVLLGAGGARWTWILGALIAYGLGYGWGGLAFYAVVRLRPDSPARATGFVNAGSAAGAALGPLGFGLVARDLSYAAAWWLTAVVVLLAGLVLWATSRRVAT